MPTRAKVVLGFMAAFFVIAGCVPQALPDSMVTIQPTGTVSVVDGANNLGTLTLNASGNASITIPVFTAGTHNIVVTYSGDSNYGN